jgi:hypothetical protein
MDYSKLNTENKVVDVIVINDSMSESDGIAFALELTGHSNWVMSEKEGRKNTGLIGSTYNETLNGFILEKPFNSWTFLEDTCLWEPPTPCPGDDYFWNEETINWIKIEE